MAALGSGGEAQQQAAGLGGAQLDGEPRGLARRAANCSGSAPPSPPEPPSTLPAEDPPSSQAGDTPHPRHEHGNPSNPLDPRGEQASATVAGTAVETHAGDEMICGPGGERGNGAATSDGQATEGVTVGLQEPPPSQRERTDPPARAQPTEPVRQWWRTPPLVTKQRPAQAGRGQKRSAQHGRQGQVQGVQQHPQQGQTPTARQGEPGSLVTQAEQTEQQRERSGQPLPRQGEPRVRGEESFQRLLSRASEPAVEGAPSPWSPFRAPPEAWRPQPTRRQRALATAQVLRQSPSREQGSRGARRETVSGTGGGPENGYQVAARRALTVLAATNDEEDLRDPPYREESLPPSEDEESEGEGRVREAEGRRANEALLTPLLHLS
ncbi:unnamed protein product [Closterium sp. Naga37s-1]|nr:unnamed protein product [Closterium sp. Naga37s-1]